MSPSVPQAVRANPGIVGLASVHWSTPGGAITESPEMFEPVGEVAGVNTGVK